MVRVVFIHPDLGIGGAERLVVDSSLALQVKDHRTVIVTAHHDRSHCFTETISGDCEVICLGDWLPRDIMGRCKALCASLRMVYITLYVMIVLQADVVIVDQVSTSLPLLRLGGFPTIFYCHYPDLLLSTARSFLTGLYRVPLDWLEQTTTGMADTVLVNSHFTRGVFRETFQRLGHVQPQVLYPSLAMRMFEGKGEKPADVPDDTTVTTFLSINRYERKKNIGLAIRALAKLGDCQARLIVAGGYDSRVRENVEHHQELVDLAENLNVTDKVIFLRSFSDDEKVWLLRQSSCLVYTPAGEHFGIVPLESMYCKTPVIAVNSGGPTETVLDGTTGWLCEGDPDQFSRVMRKILAGEVDLQQMGEAGHDRVLDNFSFAAFTDSLHDVVVDTAALSIREETSQEGGTTLFTKFALAFHFGLAMMVLYWMVFTQLP